MSRPEPAAAAGVEALARRYGLDGDARARLRLLADRLAGDENAPTAVRDPVGVLDRHLADSLVALELAAVRDARVAVDLGSGAGLPGLALAVALPGAHFALVESRHDKCAYIASLAAALGLRNVRVECTRAESWPEGIGRHDLALARALAPQPVVLEYAAPLLAPGGWLVDWRGARDPREEEAARRAAERLGMRLAETRPVSPFEGARRRHLHVFEKVSATPRGFPRRPGMARKRPLG